jgi:hypothetical protein
MIEAYCKQFFGYGRWDSPVWFVGLEEAGLGNPSELNSRLLAWDQRGRSELEDAPSFYPLCGQHQWHGPNARVQPTWRRLLRILFLARGQSVSQDAVLKFQKHIFGAFSGPVCLTEMLPLPAPSHRSWPYENHEPLPAWMRNRELFTQTVFPGRAATLREKISLHSPRAVIFYFWKHRSFAEAVAGGEFRPVIPEKLLGLERNGTAYLIIGHPAGKYPDDYFDELGQHFHEHYRELFSVQQVSLLQKAIRLATAAHHWQKRKKGSPYVLHPLRMACALKTEEEQTVAVLHDVVEDTHWTLADLKREGFPEEILQALDCVTARKGESYDDFITRALTNPIARRVKLADLEDNMNVRDLPEVTPKDAQRLNKYLMAWHRLNAT